MLQTEDILDLDINAIKTALSTNAYGIISDWEMKSFSNAASDEIKIYYENKFCRYLLSFIMNDFGAPKK